MLPKTPISRMPSSYKRGLKFLIVTEAILLGGGYLIIAACNRSQETRKKLYNFRLTYPLLQFYYGIVEKTGNNQVRQFDIDTWRALKIFKEDKPLTKPVEEIRQAEMKFE